MTLMTQRVLSIYKYNATAKALIVAVVAAAVAGCEGVAA